MLSCWQERKNWDEAKKFVQVNDTNKKEILENIRLISNRSIRGLCVKRAF